MFQIGRGYFDVVVCPYCACGINKKDIDGEERRCVTKVRHLGRTGL